MDGIILARVERLEKENRRLKRIGLGVLVLAGAVLLMGQARTNRTVEAEKFVLKDASGKVRARLEMDPLNRPMLTLLNAKSIPLIALVAGESSFLTVCATGSCEDQVQLGSFSSNKGLATGLAVYGKNKGPLHGVRIGLGVIKGVPGLNMFGEDATEQASLDLEGGPRLVLSHPDGGLVTLEKAGVELSDKQGFSTKIGTTDLETPRTGVTHRTSAASIVLFGKDNKVLWSAP